METRPATVIVIFSIMFIDTDNPDPLLFALATLEVGVEDELVVEVPLDAEVPLPKSGATSGKVVPHKAVD